MLCPHSTKPALTSPTALLCLFGQRSIEIELVLPSLVRGRQIIPVAPAAKQQARVEIRSRDCHVGEPHSHFSVDEENSAGKELPSEYGRPERVQGLKLTRPDSLVEI